MIAPNPILAKPMELRSRHRGFSLLELLAVLAIATILMTAGSMVTASILRSSQLTSDIAKLADELSLSSLESVRMNRPIRIRFYRYRDPLFPDSPARVQAFQTLTLDSQSGSYIEQSRPSFFGQGIAIHESTDASTLLTLPENKPVTGGNASSDDIVTDPELPQIAPYTYYEFEFRPDGSTNLPKDSPWGIVLAHFREGGPTSSGKAVPKNYRALGINPFTGMVKRY